MDKKGTPPAASPKATTDGNGPHTGPFWVGLLSAEIIGAWAAAAFAVATALGFPGLDPVATALAAGLAAFVVGTLRARAYHPAWEWGAWLVAGVITLLTAVGLYFYDPWDEPPPLPTSRAADARSRPPSSGYVRVVDDTGTISVDVPRYWDDRKTTQRLHEPGPLPEILASEKLVVFTRNYLVSGLHLVALPHNPAAGSSPGAALDEIFEEDYERVCSQPDVVEYHDSDFNGRGYMWEDCEGVGTVQYLWEIEVESQPEYVLLLALQVTRDADPEILTEVFNSFGFVASE